MTSAHPTIDFGFAGGAPESSNNAIIAAGEYFDSTSASPSPNLSYFLTQEMFNGSISYDSWDGNNMTAHYYPQRQPNKIPLEHSSSTSDEEDRRRIRTEDNSKSEYKVAPTDSHQVGSPTLSNSQMPMVKQRRRAQNRASQRAFRERKETHVKSLEHQLEELQKKHQDLQCSYTQQAGEITGLNASIAKLSTKINALRSNDQSSNEILTSEDFDKFDAFMSTDMMYSLPECYFDKTAVDLNSPFATHLMEDLL